MRAGLIFARFVSFLILAKVLTEAGAHPEQQLGLLEQLQGDSAAMAEIAFVGRQALWQLQNIVNATQRAGGVMRAGLIFARFVSFLIA